jgi:hypothetical protein
MVPGLVALLTVVEIVASGLGEVVEGSIVSI